MIHFMGLDEHSFDAIAAGEKEYEVRVNDDKQKLVRVGDLIEFTKIPSRDQVMTVEVTAIEAFPSFSELKNSIHIEGLDNANHEGWNSQLHSSYSEEQEALMGVLAIQVRPAPVLSPVRTISYS
ncbi:ASCH domain-containing protein [Thalassobacillus hwangdonensis]|uniref:ASCH domain-containing protein n=1 Tax=Thalassobacillus hwangdonensis TaxID=546108 RepID=A0ABW3KV01_9BACI